ncbi:MAG: hypothetical protein ABSE73_07065 [Planctomycetota bacterium]
MNCVVLQNAAGEHLGCMLCSPGLTEQSGDCVFIAVPRDAKLLGTPEAELLLQRREAGESAWAVTRRVPLSIVVRTPGLPVEMFIEFGGLGVGQWGVWRGLERQVVGLAVLPRSA